MVNITRMDWQHIVRAKVIRHPSTSVSTFQQTMMCELHFNLASPQLPLSFPPFRSLTEQTYFEGVGLLTHTAVQPIV